MLDTIQYCNQSDESFLKSTEFCLGAVLEMGKRGFGVVLRCWGVHCDSQVLTNAAACLFVDLTPFVHFLSSDREKLKGVSLHFSPLDLFKGKYILVK